MSITVKAYAAYLVICLIVTIWVAISLQKNGRKLIDDHQEENKDLFDAFTHLLIVGFYLINFGVVGLLLRYGGNLKTAEEAFELLGTKIGGILLVLGLMVFIIVAKLSKVRQREQSRIEIKQNRELFKAEHSKSREYLESFDEKK